MSLVSALLPTKAHSELDQVTGLAEGQGKARQKKGKGKRRQKKAEKVVEGRKGKRH